MLGAAPKASASSRMKSRSVFAFSTEAFAAANVSGARAAHFVALLLNLVAD